MKRNLHLAAFPLAVFCGAFLLFQVQPLIAKYILPWFGGSPAVWTTCMLFFQVVLLCGYAYAHLSSRLLGARAQCLVHLSLLAAAAAFLPIAPSAGWEPRVSDAPVPRILAILVASVGLQALVLASTGPLLQSWFTRLRRGSPYALYALSNLASLLALVSYPFLFEPNLSRREQAGWWSAGFVVYGLVSGVCAILASRAGRAGASVHEPGASEPAGPPRAGERALWFLLPACASMLLLATTNQLCVDVAVIPFLWILPLSVYLLSFILVFESPRWYRRGVFAVLLPAAVAGVIAMLDPPGHLHFAITTQIAVYCLALFVSTMVCHGELVRLKPHPRRLTSFYLMISAGGAAGGAFVALAAPLLFRGYFELHLSLALCCLIALVCYARDERSILHALRPRWAWGLIALLFTVLAGALVSNARDFTEDASSVTRNFYGVLSITEYDEDTPSMHRYVLSHGNILHGLQFEDPTKRRWPTSYYGKESGIGLVARFLHRDGGRSIGVVGLGVGTIAAWGNKDDVVRFYEIDPEVERLARTRFTYLADTPAEVEVVIGDGRISLEREPPRRFDILALDAFSSDAIPVHLLTREAFEIYLRHLAPKGVIAVHVSNEYLNLRPVLTLVADHFELAEAIISDGRAGGREEPGEAEGGAREDRRRGLQGSIWVLLSSDRSFLDAETIRDRARPPVRVKGLRPWTDDDASLFPILKR